MSESLVARNIARLIEEKGFRQGFVATKAGFGIKDFSAMLCGRKIIRADMIPPIAGALDVEPNELFKPMQS